MYRLFLCKKSYTRYILEMRYLQQIQWVLLVLLLGCFLFTHCTGEGSQSGKSSKRQQSKVEEIMTARTIGLTMLEENKLEEAEEEFMKLVSLAPGTGKGLPAPSPSMNLATGPDQRN